MATLLEQIANIKTLIDNLEALAFGDENTSATHNGQTRDSLAKAIKGKFDAIQAMVQGRLAYETKAAMDAAGAPPSGELAEVVGDTETGNNGLYYWSGSAWDRSEYDPVRQLDGVKQDRIMPSTAENIDFSAYLRNGNIDATTGEISNTHIDRRKSIVKYPLQSVTYRIINEADTSSALRVSWHDELDQLISIVSVTGGAMRDLILNPPSGAAYVSITLKSGNTDSVPYNRRVYFLASESGRFDIEELSGFPIVDPERSNTNKRIYSIEEKVDRFKSYTTWEMYGVSSGGGLNTIETQSHLSKVPANSGYIVSCTSAMYRINMFDSADNFLGQTDFLGGDEYTLPNVENLAAIDISIIEPVDSISDVVTVTPPENAFEEIDRRISAIESKPVGVAIDGDEAPVVDGVVVLPAATPSKSGYMTQEHVADIDLLKSVSLQVDGSGFLKSALAYGVSPANNADDNVNALQNAVLGGGLILLDMPGVYDVNESILLDSNTILLFGPGVVINKVEYNGKTPRYTFINRGAFSKQYNHSIGIKGLKIQSNGIGNGSDSTSAIAGMRGHVAFHYIKNLTIDDFELLDGDAQSYVIHVCTFTDIKLTNLNIEGWKDAVHLGNGDGYLVRDSRFKTYDDPIALNAHDYSSGQPELGWLRNGVIENCYDLADEVRGTTGYFARILAGAWVDWFAGMVVQQSDTVIASNGKMYRVFAQPDGTTYISNTEPSHASGTENIDGITWKMIQDTNVSYTVGVENITFRDIYLQKPRPVGISIHFDKSDFSRSYYPNAEMPIQDKIVFDGLHQQADIQRLIDSRTPVKTVKIINSEIGDTQLRFRDVGTEGAVYGKTNVLMMGNTYTADGTGELVRSENSRDVRVKALGSIKENDTYAPTFSADVTVLESDL